MGTMCIICINIIMGIYINESKKCPTDNGVVDSVFLEVKFI